MPTRRDGRDRHYSDAERAARLASLIRLNRRCDASEHCLRRATRLYRLYQLQDGERHGEPVKRRTCTRHKHFYRAQSASVEILSEQPLT